MNSATTGKLIFQISLFLQLKLIEIQFLFQFKFCFQMLNMVKNLKLYTKGTYFVGDQNLLFVFIIFS